MPFDMMLGMAELGSEEQEPENYEDGLQQTLTKCHDYAQTSIKSYQERQKRDYDMKLNQRTYSLGDLVYEIDSATKVGQSNKLKKAWKGPYIITKILSPVLYQIKNTKEPRIVHHDRLKLCSDREVPAWVTRQRNKLLENDGINTNDNIDEDENDHKKQEDLISGEDGLSDNSAKASDDKLEAKIDTEVDMGGIQELFKETMTEKQTKRGRKIRTPVRFDDFER